jgi:CheY-like chemotaxis protein
MVIDDDAMDQLVVNMTVRKHSFAEETIKMRSSQDALEYLHQHRDNAEMLPQVILLDMNMPKVTGLDFLNKYEEAFKEELKQNCPIVVLTSSNHLDDLEQAMKNPHVYSLMDKPLNLEKVELLRKLLPGNLL